MAAVLTEPDVAKAAVLESDMVHMSFPIEKSRDTAAINPVDGTPDIEIWGKVTDGTLDSDLQVVDPEASLRWIKTWFDTKANIRLGHDPKRPVGRGLEIDGHHVKALIAEPVAKHLIRSRVLNDWSVGIMNPDVVPPRDPRVRHLDPMGKAVNGVITDRPDGITGLGEISVVDRGSNYGTAFQLVKAAADGSPQWTGQLTAPDDVLAKFAAPSLTKDSGLTSVELPSDMKLKVTPATLAKMATLKQNLVLQEQAMKASVPDVAKRDFDPNVGEHGTDRDTMPEEDFAGRNRSFPIKSPGDVSDALQSIGRAGPDNYSHGKLRRNILRIAGRKGFPVPDSAGKAAEPDVAKCKCTAGMMDGVPCTSCKAGKRMAKQAAAKAATPDAVKCMKCDDSGMVGEKPCPDCEAGTKAAAAIVAKKKGKMRAVCPGCGAKQNPDHKCCPECGKPLPARALQVKKNHNFVCLGCGGELDKGEPHCPNCGKENPGYLPEADRKIPANMEADKSAGKDRVAKAKKKSGKKDKMPFGGNQAKPFGAEDEKEKPDEKPGKAEKRRKGKSGKRYGRDPAEGVKGHETRGLPPHREPDGAPVEQFEDDAHLQDGDQQMKAAMRHKSLAGKYGIEPHEAVLHDLTCPAFSPESVSKCLPHASFGTIDTAWWAAQALKAAAGEDVSKALDAYNHAQVLSRAAVMLKTADPQALHRIRLANHDAFLQANDLLGKTFRDATPGPGTAPTPAHVMPQSFRRPYITAGHAAESPQAEGARTFPVISDHPQAQDFHRGYLAAGHASESPENSGRPEPMPTGSAGMPESAASHAGMMQARDYEQATSTMHDHLSRIAPGMCPMSPPMGSTQGAAHPVPDPVGMIEPHKAKVSKADKAAQKAARRAKTAKKAARVAAQKAKARKRKLERQALKAATPILPVPTPLHAAAGEPGVTQAPALDSEVIAAAVKAALTPVLKHQKATDKALRRNQKVLNAIAGQPDTSQAPFRGAGVYKASAAPAAPQTAAEAAALAQTGHLQRLRNDWRNSHIPEVREAAYKELTAQLGLNPMTDNPTSQHPFTT